MSGTAPSCANDAAHPLLDEDRGRSATAIGRLPSLLALVVIVAGCSGPQEPGRADPEPSPPQREALTVVPFDNESFGRGATMHGCASVADLEDAGYTLPVLIWTRLRVRERLRLLPATYSRRSSSVDTVTQYVGPDPGPRAPNLAVSIGPVGAGPTADRLTYDTYLIGDARDSAAGLDAAQASWTARAPLESATSLAPGDHYLFVEIDPAKGGMDLHGLTVRWTHGGERGQTPIGRLSLRVQCGG